MIEQQLRQSEKMQAIGQIAGGIAHDFNMLGAIIGSVEVLKLSMEADENQEHWLDLILQSGERAAGSLVVY